MYYMILAKLRVKSYQNSFPITMAWNSKSIKVGKVENSTNVEIKQYAHKQIVIQRINQKGNLKKYLNKQKEKHNMPKFMGYSRNSSDRKFIALTICLP